MPRPELRWPGRMSRATTAAMAADPILFRPNDGSGVWADFSNTGYLYSAATPSNTTIPCTHGYTGLYDYTSGMTATGFIDVSGSNGQNFNKYHFRGKVGIGQTSGDNFVFSGCLFDSTFPSDTSIQSRVATSLTFSYCTMKPAATTTPPGNNGTVSSAHSAPGTTCANSWQYAAAFTGAVHHMDHCDVWGNAGVEFTNNGGLATLSNPATFTWCYIHDQADTDNSGGCAYHHDGIGPDSAGGGTFNTIDHCTIASLGTTNGVALQGTSSYDHIRLTSCYISGWGYAVAIGATTPFLDTNLTITDNVFSAELACIFGPFYDFDRWNSGGGTNLWRRNRYQVRAGDGNTSYTTADNGQYWYPVDNISHASDYTG